MPEVVNIVIAGLGGQGVVKASDMLAEAAFRAGWDVKKSEVHGMSQRGGSVSSDVRFGPRVFSPMVPPGEADFLVVVSTDQVEPNQDRLKPHGLLITPAQIDQRRLANRKSINVALMGVLSRHLDIPEDAWVSAIRSNLPERLLEANLKAFQMGRENAK